MKPASARSGRRFVRLRVSGTDTGGRIPSRGRGASCTRGDRIPCGTGEGEDVRRAALLVALITIIVGIAGLVSPDSVTTVRRLYFATPLGLYAATAVRVSMGI